jgi:GTP cyclohydrolase I
MVLDTPEAVEIPAPVRTVKEQMAIRDNSLAESDADNQDVFDGPGSLGMEPLIREMLERLGEDPTREGLLRTPHRVDRAWAFLTSGYRADLDKIVNNAIFNNGFSDLADEMVVVRDIEFYSLCEHHMIPFFGVCHVAYLPGEKIIGLSKIPRIVEVFARRLQVQERLSSEVADCLEEILKPRGVAVVMEAKHMCMCMRGIQKQNSWTSTSIMKGDFREKMHLRSEFLQLIQSSRHN